MLEVSEFSGEVPVDSEEETKLTPAEKIARFRNRGKMSVAGSKKKKTSSSAKRKPGEPANVLSIVRKGNSDMCRILRGDTDHNGMILRANSALYHGHKHNKTSFLGSRKIIR